MRHRAEFELTINIDRFSYALLALNKIRLARIIYLIAI